MEDHGRISGCKISQYKRGWLEKGVGWPCLDLSAVCSVQWGQTSYMSAYACLGQLWQDQKGTLIQYHECLEEGMQKSVSRTLMCKTKKCPSKNLSSCNISPSHEAGVVTWIVPRGCTATRSPFIRFPKMLCWATLGMPNCSSCTNSTICTWTVRASSWSRFGLAVWHIASLMDAVGQLWPDRVRCTEILALSESEVSHGTHQKPFCTTCHNGIIPSSQLSRRTPRKLRSDSAHRVAELPRLNPCSSGPAAKFAWIWLYKLQPKFFEISKKSKQLVMKTEETKTFFHLFTGMKCHTQSFASDWSKDVWWLRGKDTEIKMKTKNMKCFVRLLPPFLFSNLPSSRWRLTSQQMLGRSPTDQGAVHHQSKLL